MLHFQNSHNREASLSEAERRSSERHPSRGTATLIRENDHMREGAVGTLHDISIMGLGLLFHDAELLPEVGEGVKVRLRNDVQRVDREVRGTVRHITQVVDGRHLVGIELALRLTPLEVSLLKMPTEIEDKGTWM